MDEQRAHVYLIPGLFGFGTLGGYDYFEHLERELLRRYRQRGVELRLEVIAAPPTGSIARRATVVANAISDTVGDLDHPIHLVGHSTGGLDARLLLSPARNLSLPPERLAWTRNVRSLVTLNTPHHGTPLAAYFTTVAGTRLLYALSLLTVTTLTLGKLPLTAFSTLVAAVGAIDDKLGVDIHLLDQLTDQLLRIVGERGRGEMHDYLAHVHDDQGGIVQLMPEVMELFNASVPNHPAVRYGCTLSAAPSPGTRRLLRAVLSPLSALSLALYTTVYGFTSRADTTYPYGAPTPGQARLLLQGLGFQPTTSSVDGIVPSLSMLHGELLWCGPGDHLDVVGHFADDRKPALHVDWLQSGAKYSRAHFARMVNAVAAFQLDTPG